MALQRAVRSGNATNFKFEKKGDNLKGYYIGTKEVAINGSQVKEHTFKTPEGVFTVLGQADLYKQLTENGCQGCYVEATFSGNMQKLKGNRTMKLYDVDFNLADKYTGHLEISPESEPDFVEETDVADDTEAYVSEAPAPRAAAPKTPVRTPSAEQQAKVRALLQGKSKTA